MIFDLGCCCSQPITGLYDFYGLSSYGETLNPVILDSPTFEIDSVLSRHPSHRIIIANDVIGNSNRISDVFRNNRISCVINDWYINLVSGSGMNDNLLSLTSYSSSLDDDEKQYTISPNYSSELVWLRHSEITDINSSYNALYSGSTGLGSGWAVGSGARIDGNSVILTLTGVTSGAYIEKTLPNSDIPWYLRFQLNSNYDKYLLLTTESTGATVQPYSGYNIWLNTSSPQSINAYTINTGEVSLFFPDVVAYKVGDYIEYNISFDHFLGDMYDGFDPITKLRISLVDSLSGFTIDDVSGYSANIREIYFSYGKNREDYYLTSTPYPGRCQISLINTENKTITTRFNPRSGIYLGNHITGTNIATLTRMTGYRMDEEQFFGRLPDDYLTLDDYYYMDNHYHSTINMDRISNFISFNFASSGDFHDGSWPYGNVIISYIDSNSTSYSTSVSQNGTGISFRAFTEANPFIVADVGKNIHLYDWSSYYNSLKIRESYDSMYLLDHTGGTGFVFGENFRLENAEYDIPTGVKWIVATGGYTLLEPYESDFNSSVNFPRIQVFPPRDFPNCFSVLQPKAVAKYKTTGTLGTQPTQQTIEILYGPYKKATQTIGYASGQGDTIPLLNITGLTKHPIIYGPTNNLSGAIVDIEHHYIYGDTGNSQVFWSDTTTQERSPYALYTTNGSGIYYYGLADDIGTAIYYPNVSAKVLWGDCYNNTPAAIFSHGYNHTGNGTSIVGASGESYIKVKIGDNIVFNKRLWADSYYLPISPMAMARGLTALQNTESTQTANMSGNSSAFVWFEKLWETEPSVNHTGIESGWRMHVSNSTGLDLWTLDATGHHAIWDVDSPASFSYDERRRPRVVASSDRYFYVNDFFVPCRGGVPDNFSFNIIYPTGFTGFTPSSGVFFYLTMTGEYINGSPHVAFSHDGQCRFPLGRTYDNFNSVVANKDTGYTINLPIGTIPYLDFYLGETTIYDIYRTDCVKNSNKLPYCPPYNMYSNPTGSTLYISPFSGMSSGTGIGLDLYTLISGSIIVGSGVVNSGYYD